MTPTRPDRRAALAFIPGMVLSGFHSPLRAQPVAQAPLPPAWQMLGMVQWPQPHALLRLEFDEIVLPGDVPLMGRSGLRFTQSLMLFTSTRQAPAAFEQIAMKTLSAGNSAELRFTLKATRTLTVTLLAKTPAGWFRTDRELKVGKAPG